MQLFNKWLMVLWDELDNRFVIYSAILTPLSLDKVVESHVPLHETKKKWKWSFPAPIFRGSTCLGGKPWTSFNRVTIKGLYVSIIRQLEHAHTISKANLNECNGCSPSCKVHSHWPIRSLVKEKPLIHRPNLTREVNEIQNKYVMN